MVQSYEGQSKSLATWLLKVNILYHICCHFLTYSCNINAYFQLLFSAVYALITEFLFWLSDHDFTVIFSDSSSITQVPWRQYFKFLIGNNYSIGNNYWEPSLDCRQDGLVEQIHSCRELNEQPVTCVLVLCQEKVKLLIDNFRQCFCLITPSNLNVGSM